MWAVMKCAGWARSSGRSSFTDSESASGVVGVDGVVGIEEGMFEVGFDAVTASFSELEGSGVGSGDGSTCCVVELKYLARKGRRKVGGSEELGIRVSRMDFRRVLLIILRI